MFSYGPKVTPETSKNKIRKICDRKHISLKETIDCRELVSKYIIGVRKFQNDIRKNKNRICAKILTRVCETGVTDILQNWSYFFNA